MMLKEYRRCYFKGELNLTAFKVYTQSNCINECIMLKVFETCSCVQMFMPRSNACRCITYIKGLDTLVTCGILIIFPGEMGMKLCWNETQIDCIKEVKSNELIAQ